MIAPEISLYNAKIIYQWNIALQSGSIRTKVDPTSAIHITWTDNDPSTAGWACPECGGFIDYEHHFQMCEAGYWLGEHWEWRHKTGYRFEDGFHGKIGFQDLARKISANPVSHAIFN